MTPPRTLSLGIRIVALVVPLALMPLAVVGGVAYYYLEVAVRSELEASEMRSAADAVQALQATVSEARRVADVLASLPQLAALKDDGPDPSGGTQAAIARRAVDVSVQLSRSVVQVTVIGRRGEPVVRVASPTHVVSPLPAALMRMLSEGLDPPEGQPVLVRTGDAVSAFVVRPILALPGRARVVAEVRLDRVISGWNDVAGPRGGAFLLVDADALVMGASARSEGELPAADLSVIVGRRAVAPSVLRDDLTTSGHTVVVAGAGAFAQPGTASPGPRPVYVVRLAQEGPLVERLDELRRSALLMSGIAIALGLVGAGLIARTVVHPLSGLLDMTRRIGEGQLHVTLAKARDDEIGQLIDAFNQMSASLADLQDTLVRAETFAALGRVASTVAHEVRNPLNAMRGCIDYLRLKRPDDPVVQHYAGIIGEEVTALDGFVRDFLKVARIESPELADIDLVELLRARMQLHEARASERHIHLDLAADLPVRRIRADPHQIGIVFENLINNAFDAMPEGGQLRIRLESSPDGVEVTVADTGIGIAPAIAKNLFTPFFTTKTGGTGIGLAISRRILEAHGGSIAFQSTVSEGSEFRVTLPVHEASPDEHSSCIGE